MWGEGMDGGEVEGRRFKRSRWEEVYFGFLQKTSTSTGKQMEEKD